MAKDAVALRDFRVGENPGTSYPKGKLIRGMADNQFADFEAVELVRAATADDLSPSAPAPADSQD